MGDGGGGTGIVLVPPPVQVEYLSGSESMVTAANQTTLAWTDMLQAARALSCALAQHQSAVEAGIKSHVALQRAATAYYAANLASSLKFCGDTFRYLGHELEQAGAWNVRITLQDVLALRDRIVAKGRFPDSEQSVAEQINATEEEIASALTEVKAATFADLPDEFSLAELCVMMSHAFQEFELSEYVPDWVEG